MFCSLLDWGSEASRRKCNQAAQCSLDIRRVHKAAMQHAQVLPAGTQRLRHRARHEVHSPENFRGRQLRQRCAESANKPLQNDAEMVLYHLRPDGGVFAENAADEANKRLALVSSSAYSEGWGKKGLEDGFQRRLAIGLALAGVEQFQALTVDRLNPPE